jgi:16S rRNA (uracil1498-N3)-methyltransferase
MQSFYTEIIDHDKAYLEGQEMIHCTKVLRKKVGDVVHLLDGKGKMYECEIAKIEKKGVVLDLLKILQEESGAQLLPSIGVGLIKNTTRIEWMIEKATEIGVSVISPLLCQRSERARINLERLDKIVVSAMKQSMRLYKPVIVEPIDFAQYVNQYPEKTRLIAHYHVDNPQLSQMPMINNHIDILIGPEGDFVNDEIDLATKSGYSMVNMGTSRLRTETAAIVALTLINNK